MLNTELVEDFGLNLPRALTRRLSATGQDNSSTICQYIKNLGVEIRLSDNYKKLNTSVLVYLSEFVNNRRFKELHRDDIISFLTSEKERRSRSNARLGIDV